MDREPRIREPDLTTICLVFAILFFSFIKILMDICKVLNHVPISYSTLCYDWINDTLINVGLVSLALLNHSSCPITKDDLPIKFDGIDVTKEKVADLNKVYVEFPDYMKLNVTYSTTEFGYIQISHGSDGIHIKGANHFKYPQCYEERFPSKMIDNIDNSSVNFTDQYHWVFFVVDIKKYPEKWIDGEIYDSQVVNILHKYVNHMENGLLLPQMPQPFNNVFAMQLKKEKIIPVQTMLENLLNNSLKCVYLDDDGKVIHDMIIDGFKKQLNDKTFDYLYFFEIDDSSDTKSVVSIHKLRWTSDMTLKIRENMGQVRNVDFKLKKIKIYINRDPKTFNVYGISVNVKGLKHNVSKDLNPDYSNCIDRYLPSCIAKTIRRNVMTYLRYTF